MSKIFIDEVYEAIDENNLDKLNKVDLMIPSTFRITTLLNDMIIEMSDECYSKENFDHIKTLEIGYIIEYRDSCSKKNGRFSKMADEIITRDESDRYYSATTCLDGAECDAGNCIMPYIERYGNLSNATNLLNKAKENIESGKCSFLFGIKKSDQKKCHLKFGGFEIKRNRSGDIVTYEMLSSYMSNPGVNPTKLPKWCPNWSDGKHDLPGFSGE